MSERQVQLEQQLDQYAQSLHMMQRQVTTLENQLLQMLQAQFTSLASAITTTLQLPQDQADILQDLVADHLRQLTVTAQLHPPRDQGVTHHRLPTTAEPTVTRPEAPQLRTRDPRLTQARARLEG